MSSFSRRLKRQRDHGELLAARDKLTKLMESFPYGHEMTAGDMADLFNAMPRDLPVEIVNFHEGAAERLKSHKISSDTDGAIALGSF